MANSCTADKPWTHMEVEHAQGSGTTHFYLANIGEMGHGSEVKKGMVLAVGRREKPILGFPLKLFWGKCPAGMTYHPEDGKMSWNH